MQKIDSGHIAVAASSIQEPSKIPDEACYSNTEQTLRRILRGHPHKKSPSPG